MHFKGPRLILRCKNNYYKWKYTTFIVKKQLDYLGLLEWEITCGLCNIQRQYIIYAHFLYPPTKFKHFNLLIYIKEIVLETIPSIYSTFTHRVYKQSREKKQERRRGKNTF